MENKKENTYKLIIINYMNSNSEYFKEMSSNNIPLFTNDIDYAMNFHNLQESEIDHFLDLISKQLWKLNHIPDVKNLEIFEMNIQYNIKKIPYKNEDFETMNAIKKLTPREIEILGLEDYGLLYKLQVDEEQDMLDYSPIIWGNGIQGNISIPSIGYVSNNIMSDTLASYKSTISPEEYLLNSIKNEWKNNNEI